MIHYVSLVATHTIINMVYIYWHLWTEKWGFAISFPLFQKVIVAKMYDADIAVLIGWLYIIPSCMLQYNE